MESVFEHHSNQVILSALGISSLEQWTDDARFDESIFERIKSSPELVERVATTQDAVMLFYLLLGRHEGEERVGRKCIDIVNELWNSEEFKSKKLSYQISRHEMFTLQCEAGDIIIRSDGDIAQGQAIYSCYIEYISGVLYLTIPKNFDKPNIERRFIPYLPIFCESLKILQTIKSKTKAIDFFYGDIPTRDTGLTFCSNKINDYLLPDFDTLSIFKNLSKVKPISWEYRKPCAYFRGTDTGSPSYKNINRSQRFILCSLALSNPIVIDAKITSCESESDIDFYKKKGVWGDREPQSNIGQYKYKYNIDVDGHSNSWAGLVNKLYRGYGGVTLKVESPEGYRQWFYNRLQPWINFVPINTELSDLLEKIDFLKKNDGIACGIYENTSHFFDGIDYNYLKNFSAHTIVSALLRLR